MRGSLIWVASAAIVCATLFIAFSPPKEVVELEACVPCENGPSCNAGCLTGLAAAVAKKARTQKLALPAKQEHRVRQTRGRTPVEVQSWEEPSLHQQEDVVLGNNARLLRLQGSGKGDVRLGDILNHAVHDIVKAEAAEVRLRREAQGNAQPQTVGQAYSKLSPSRQQLFHLRARELELALDQADKEITKAGEAVLPWARNGKGKVVQAKSKGGESANWTTAMSKALSSLVSDGSGKVWGVNAGNHVRVANKAHTQRLPGIVTNNWNLDKGSLSLVPKGDDPKLPGVKTLGW